MHLLNMGRYLKTQIQELFFEKDFFHLTAAAFCGQITTIKLSSGQKISSLVFLENYPFSIIEEESI